MTFHSVLFKDSDHAVLKDRGIEEFFADLHFDQIIDAIIAGKEEYDLRPFFALPLDDVAAINFRHEVMRDLQAAELFGAIKTFARSMHLIRDYLARAEKHTYERQQERWFLDAVNLYAEAVGRLLPALCGARSRGIIAFRDYLAEYVSSAPFTALSGQARRLADQLSAIRYNILIQGLRVTVYNHEEAPDYSAEITAAFQRFQQGPVQQYRFEFNDALEMNHVEARILDGVAQLNQQTFSELAEFRAANRNFLDPAIVTFDREIQFYVAYQEYVDKFKKSDLNFCYPRIVESSKEIYSHQGFDLALAGALIGKAAVPICNDFYLRGPQRVIVVSGPNQGGKTTFARTFGQLHYLASLGCPVPGTDAQLYLFDRMFTHFEKEERMANLRGKLEDDIIRIHQILRVATTRSIVIINEIFASTALSDALFLSKQIAAAIIDLDLLCVWVTFLDEISRLSDKTVSMVSEVAPDNPAQRTFKITRRPANGLAYAMSLAEKYRLTYEVIRERLGS